MISREDAAQQAHDVLRNGAGPGGSVARFTPRARAEEQAEFMRMGMEDEVQSINVVEAPDA